jgi:hypothetical protein
MGLIQIILDIINFIISTIVNLIMLLVEIVLWPFRALAVLLCGGTTGRQPWAWSWQRRSYFGGGPVAATPAVV